MHNEDVRRQALVLLGSPENYPALPVRPTARIQLRIWQYPSFEPFASWALLTDGQTQFVRRVVWHHARQSSLEPETYGAEVPISRTVTSELLESLQALTLPLHVPAAGIGLDGTRFGMEVLDHMSSTRLTWWEAQPPEWRPLHEWHAHAVQCLEEVLPRRTAQ